MSRIDLLKTNYQRLCKMEWDHNVSGSQRVWLAVYDKEDERKLRFRLGLFEEATQQSGHKWIAIDLTNAFGGWMCDPKNSSFAERYFKSPNLLDDGVLGRFKHAVVSQIQSVLSQLPDPDNTVLALYGISSLFGFLKISEIIPMIEGDLRGRLLVFFPGAYEQNNFRLLDARDGWNYLATQITASDVEART